MATRKNKTEITLDTTAAHAVPARGTRTLAQQPALPGLASALAQQPPRYVTLAPSTTSAPLPATAAAPIHRDAPAHRTCRQTGVRQRFGELRSALADGWEIVQPIFARPLWSASDDSLTAFNFVLRREGATRLLTVPEGRTVQRFVRDRRLIVDYRR